MLRLSRFLRIEDRLDGRVVEGEGAVDRGVGFARTAGAGIARIGAAGAAQLADDLRRAVEDRRAAAAAVDRAGDVTAVDALAARPAGAGRRGRVHVVLRVDLGLEGRIADPVELRAVGVRDRRARPAQEDRAGGRV